MNPQGVKELLEAHTWEYEHRPIKPRSERADDSDIFGPPVTKTREVDDIGDWFDGAPDGPVDGLGFVERVESAGGEGEGDSAHFVLKVSADDGAETFYKMYGSYASFDGFYWDGPFVEVQPVERTVTFYEEAK